MRPVPYWKAHGARNDFLFTWADELPPDVDRVALARAICDRHTGIGGDGWYVVAKPGEGAPARVSLLNADGSASELSGNGTRCAAALLLEAGLAQDPVEIDTGAGRKLVRLESREGLRFALRMGMGLARFPEGTRSTLTLESGGQEVTVVDVGNPQCAVFVESFDFDWRAMGAEIEWHAHFPRRTNVSFVRKSADDTLEVRFWERGVGETQSSGTGSTGAAAAARQRGLVGGVVTVMTPAGALQVRWRGDEMELTGPAELTGHGVFYYLP
jgi:diaminopimelate epimerase